MAKRRATAGQRDRFSAPPDADLYYIPEQLRQFAVRIDSLVFDQANVKDHGERDLPTHQKSLEEFGIRRLLVVRRENRQILAGNGTAMASQRNGWEYVPVVFVDDDAKRGKAFALADNAIGALADWDEEQLKLLTADALEWAGALDIDALVGGILENLGAETSDETKEESDGGQQETPKVAVGDVLVTRRVVVTCISEKQQLELIARLQSEGFECDVSSRLAK